MLTVTQNLVLPTAITGSYPRPLWFDLSLDGRSFKSALGESLASRVTATRRAAG
jgi:5-methyltetrahydropteroyltriglutamate--homocysteine methyltransferase